MTPERPGSLPLAELVTRRRGLLSMSLEEAAQRIQKAAESEDEYCAFTRQTIHEIEHGRIPHPRNVRWLAAGLGLPAEQVTQAARQQRMNRRGFVQATAVGAESGDYRDEVASAAREAEAERLRLLAEPGPGSIDSLGEGTLEIARAANRGALDLFIASRQIRCNALKLAGQTCRPGALSGGSLPRDLIPCWETPRLSPALSVRHAGIKMRPSSIVTHCVRGRAANLGSAVHAPKPARQQRG